MSKQGTARCVKQTVCQGVCFVTDQAGHSQESRSLAAAAAAVAAAAVAPNHIAHSGAAVASALQRTSPLKAVITAFPSVSLPFLAVPLRAPARSPLSGTEKKGRETQGKTVITAFNRTALPPTPLS
eukprot:SAG22_NODE_2152_length_2924_cov_1.454867_1_plen_125_part_10